MLGLALSILLLAVLAGLDVGGRADLAWVVFSIVFALAFLAGMAHVLDGMNCL